MAKSFDYSKWDNIELSDDESDLHPNIDKESWFRLKHRTRLEREAREDEEIQEYTKKNLEDEARVKLIESRIEGVKSGEGEDADFVDTEALEIELKELQTKIHHRKQRMAEIQEKRKWTIDNICRVKEEKTVVNKITSAPLKSSDGDSLTAAGAGGGSIDLATSPTAQAILASEAATALPQPPTTVSKPAVVASNPSPPPVVQGPTLPNTSSTITTEVNRGIEPAANIQRQRMAVISYNDFCIKHEKILETYCEIQDLEASKEYLFKHCDILLHEHAQSYILLSCLEDEMNGKHKRMKLDCRQSQILTHIQELGLSMKRDPRDVILPFFRRIGEKEYLQGFLAAVDDFIIKIQKRAVEKRKEMDAERAARIQAGEEEEEEEYEESSVQLGPGGLNPITVLKSLPKAMRDAFESQDIGQLNKVLGEMDPKDAKFYMKQCVDSGLWVAKDPTIFDDSQPDEAEEDDDQLEGEGNTST